MRNTERRWTMLALAGAVAAMQAPAVAQGLPGVLPAGAPPPREGTGYFMVGTPNPVLEGLGNYIATPAGVERTANGGSVPVQYVYGLPQVLQHPIVPTDTTGIGGSLGYAQNLRLLLLGYDRNTLPNENGFIVPRDPRYRFDGKWRRLNWGLAAAPSVMTAGCLSQSAVIADAVAPVFQPGVRARLSRLFAFAGGTDASRIGELPQVMPAAGSAYSAQDGALTLAAGAVLVKTGAGPLVVRSSVGDRPITVALAHDTLAMVSLFGNHFTIANLTDAQRDGVQLFVGDPADRRQGFTPVRVGHAAMVFPTGECPADPKFIAYLVHRPVALPRGLSVQSMRISYAHTLKRFNITPALDDCDLSKVLKTAAAVSYIDMERMWNGFAPYVP